MNIPKYHGWVHNEHGSWRADWVEDLNGGGDAQEGNQPVTIGTGAQSRARTALAPTVNLAAHGRPEKEMECAKYRGESRLGTNDRPAAIQSSSGPGRGRWDV